MFGFRQGNLLLHPNRPIWDGGAKGYGMWGVLLAAGEGRKFWPFADVRNKCAFPIGTVPMVRRMAEQLVAAGASRLVAVIGVGGGSVRAALAGLACPVEFLEQPAPRGSAEALARALPLIGSDPCVVAYGDVVADAETVAAVWRATRGGETPAVAAVAELHAERPGDWITCDVRDGALGGLQGHGRGGAYRLGGIFGLQSVAYPYVIANPGVMTHVPVGGMPALEAELAESLARMVDDDLPIQAVLPTGFLADVDKPWHILQATTALLTDRSRRLGRNEIADGARVADSAEISGQVVLEPGAVIGERCVIRGDAWIGRGASVTNGSILQGRVLLGENARVRDYALVSGNTVLGPQSICGHGAEFDGVLLEGSYLYHYCEIYGVLGARVDIGAATVCGTLRFDDSQTTHRIGGRPEQPGNGANASFLGDYSRTGVNAILMPGVKVGAYSCVGAGVILYDDLPSRQLVLARQELVHRPWGPERYGW